MNFSAAFALPLLAFAGGFAPYRYHMAPVSPPARPMTVWDLNALATYYPGRPTKIPLRSTQVLVVEAGVKQ